MVRPQWVSSVALAHPLFLQFLAVKCSRKLSNALHPLLFPLSITACLMSVHTAYDAACLREMYPHIVLTTFFHCSWRHLLLPGHITHCKDHIHHGQQDYQRIVDGWWKSSSLLLIPGPTNAHGWRYWSKGEPILASTSMRCQRPALFHFCSLLAKKVACSIESQSNLAISLLLNLEAARQGRSVLFSDEHPKVTIWRW